MQRKQRLLASWSLLAVGALGLAGTGALAETGLIHAAPADYVVTNCTTSNSAGAGNTPAQGDLEYAVDYANTTPGTITFNCAPGSKIAVVETLLVSNAYTINGLTTDGKTPIILDGGKTVEIMEVSATATGALTLENATLQNGWVLTSVANTTAQGGAMLIDTDATVDLTNDTFLDNEANTVAGVINAYVGGGAIEDQGVLTVDHSTFTGNLAESNTNCYMAYGGAIDVEGTVALSIKDHSTFTDNQAVCANASGTDNAYGGALFDDSSAPTDSIADSTFTGNEAISTGTNGNSAESDGGAVYLARPTGVISGSSFTNNAARSTSDTNTAQALGGGVQTDEGTSLTDTTFTGNKAVGTNTNTAGSSYAYGGGLYTQGLPATTGSTFPFSGNTFSGNQANDTYFGGEGGGMFAYSIITETADTYTGNSVSGPGAFGGAIANAYSLTLSASTISGNSATGEPYTASTPTEPTYGGGIASYYILSLDNSTITGNTVSGTDSGGGGVDNYASTLEIANSTIAGNKAEGTGSQAGGLDTTTGPRSEAAQTAVGGSIVAGNSAASGPDCNTDSGSTLVDNGYNLESATDCFGKTPPKGDKQNVSNAGLASKLANNGGPTQTLALLAGSPAIDQIPTTGASGTNSLTSYYTGKTTETYTYDLCPGSPAQDQRGVTRPQGSACDMGAYEYKPSSTGLSGNGAPSAPVTAQAPSGSHTANVSRGGHARTLPAQPKVAASTHTHASVSTVSSGFPLALAVLLAILCFGLMGGGAVLLVRTRKVDGR